jgi:hypothetical protein
MNLTPNKRHPRENARQSHMKVLRSFLLPKERKKNEETPAPPNIHLFNNPFPREGLPANNHAGDERYAAGMFCMQGAQAHEVTDQLSPSAFVFITYRSPVLPSRFRVHPFA